MSRLDEFQAFRLKMNEKILAKELFEELETAPAAVGVAR